MPHQTPDPTDSALAALRSRVEAAERRIEAARLRGAHAASAVMLVIVTKSVPGSMLPLVAALPRRDVGENRILDAAAKRQSAPRGLVWHGIGHLQTNKAKKAIETFDVFHALDSLHLAEVLEPLLAAVNRRWPVYAQVNAARDPAKRGVPPEEALAFLAALRRFPHLDVVGLMTIGREEDRGEAARPAFRTLREVRDEALRAGFASARADTGPLGLSMGMSDDFETAIEEGATIVRLGRTLWEQATPDPALDVRTPGRTVSPEAR